MTSVRLLVECDEASALRLAEAIWDAGGAVRILVAPSPEKERVFPDVANEADEGPVGHASRP